MRGGSLCRGPAAGRCRVKIRLLEAMWFCVLPLLAQAGAAAPPAQPAVGESRVYTVAEGTRIPLQLINSVSTKTAAVG